MPKKSVNLIPSLTDKDGNSVTDSSKIAEMFNDFFTNISTKINDSIPHTKMSPLDYLTNRNDKPFFISPTTQKKLKQLLSRLIVRSPLAPTAYQLGGGGEGGSSEMSLCDNV